MGSYFLSVTGSGYLFPYFLLQSLLPFLNFIFSYTPCLFTFYRIATIWLARLTIASNIASSYTMYDLMKHT